MYTIDEACLQLPAPLQDRSVNVLGFAEPSTQAPFQIIINRDQLLGDETVPECFDRQLAALTRQARQFKIIRRDSQPRAGLQPLYTVHSSFQQGGRVHHQLQCMLLTRPPGLLVLTLASGVPINEGHRKVWTELLATLDPAGGRAEPSAAREPPEAA